MTSHSVGAFSRLNRFFDARPLRNRFILEDEQIGFGAFLRIQVDFRDDEVGAGPPVGGTDGRLESVGLGINIRVVFAITLKFLFQCECKFFILLTF